MTEFYLGLGLEKGLVQGAARITKIGESWASQLGLASTVSSRFSETEYRHSYTHTHTHKDSIIRLLDLTNFKISSIPTNQ